MVDINIASLLPRLPVVRALPLPRLGVAVGADVEVRAVAVQDCLARVAVALDGAPVGEEVAVVAVLRALGGDSDVCEEGFGGVWVWDVFGFGEGEG